MTNRKIFNSFMLATAAFITMTASAFSQDYEVYDGDVFSVMFTVEHSIAKDVKFASKGAEKWTDFEVIDVKNWNGTGGNNSIFSFYVLDGKLNSYQIDYYEDGYIWVFKIDNDRKATGGKWKLNKREEKKKERITTLKGMIFHYMASEKTGCLFTISDMVDAGIAKRIDDKVIEECYSENYGYGALINFENVPKNSPYTKPSEGVLMSFEGTWKVVDGLDIFYVKSMEPFF